MCTKKVMDHFMNPRNMEEIDIAVSHLEDAVMKLRQMSPFEEEK